MPAWGRNYGRIAKCGKRRTAPDKYPLICRKRQGHDDPRSYAPGPTEHEAVGGWNERKVYVWGLEPRAPLRVKD